MILELEFLIFPPYPLNSGSAGGFSELLSLKLSSVIRIMHPTRLGYTE